MNFIENNLSIRLQSDGFFWATYNRLEDDSFTYGEEKIIPGKDYTERLKQKLLDNNILLQEQYKEINVIVATQRFLLSPIEMIKAIKEIQELNSDEIEKNIFYLNHAPQAEEEHLIIENYSNSEIQLSYAINKDLYLFLQRTLPNIVFHHPINILNTYFIEKSKFGNNAKVFAHVFGNELSILIYRNGKLQLANNYTTTSEADNIAYFILNTWQCCKLDYSQDILQLAGSKPLIAAITPILAQFIHYTQPAIFPMEIFKLGSDTLSVPLDMALLTTISHNSLSKNL